MNKKIKIKTSEEVQAWIIEATDPPIADDKHLNIL